jgi:hypothetical protein
MSRPRVKHLFELFHAMPINFQLLLNKLILSPLARQITQLCKNAVWRISTAY